MFAFALSLSLALEHPSNYYLGAHLTQAAAQLPATEPRAALAYAEPIPLTSRPPLFVCRYCGHLQRGGNEVRKHCNVARDQLFIQDRRQWSRAPCPRGPSTYSNGAACPRRARFPSLPSSSSSPSKRPRTMHSCPRARSRSRGPQRRRFATLSVGRQQRSPRRPARAPLTTCTW